MDLEKINKIIDVSKIHIFYKNKELKQLAEKTLGKVGEAIKNNVNPPKTDKKVYLIKISLNPKANRKIIIICTQYTINNKLNLSANISGVTVEYTQADLDKYGFKLSHVKKIIDALKNDDIDYEKDFVSIREIIG